MSISLYWLINARERHTQRKRERMKELTTTHEMRASFLSTIFSFFSHFCFYFLIIYFRIPFFFKFVPMDAKWGKFAKAQKEGMQKVHTTEKRIKTPGDNFFIIWKQKNARRSSRWLLKNVACVIHTRQNVKEKKSSWFMFWQESCDLSHISKAVWH